MTELRVFTALVTFERTNNATQILPPEAQGACGYMAVAALDEDRVFDTLRASLSADGLRLLDVKEICETSIADFPDDLDEHLMENVRDWEPNKQAVWGTIHVYLADGEA